MCNEELFAAGRIMLYKRVIPLMCIDREARLVKTVQHAYREYLGDPLNAGFIYSAFQADEIILLDIDASRYGYVIDHQFVDKMSRFCRGPLAVGGGIKSGEEIKRVLSSGAERVILGRVLDGNMGFLKEASSEYGQSSITAIVDILFDGIDYMACFGYSSGKSYRRYKVHDVLEELEANGAGEVVLNCVYRDGTRKGIDNNLIAEISGKIGVPIVVAGGCNGGDDIKRALKSKSIAGVACSSEFSYYPETSEVLLSYEKNTWIEGVK